MGNIKGTKMTAPTKQQLRDLVAELREEVKHLKNELKENESLRDKLASKVKDKGLVEIEKLHAKERELESIKAALSSVQKKNVDLLRESKSKLDAMAQLVPAKKLPNGYLQVIDPDLIHLHQGDGWRFDVYIEQDGHQKLLTRIPTLYEDCDDNIETERFEAALSMRNHLKNMYRSQIGTPVTINFSHTSHDLMYF